MSYSPNLANAASNALESGSSDLCRDAKSDSELFELICEMVEYLDGNVAVLQDSVRAVADEVNLRVNALLILLNAYTPDRVQAEVDRLKAEMLLLLADVIEDVVCNGVEALKRVGDSVWESAALERHKLIISTITQAITAPPQLALGGPSGIPKMIKIVEKARKLSNLASLIRVIAKVIRLIGRLLSVVADIQGMVADVNATINRLDELLSGRGSVQGSLSSLRSTGDNLVAAAERNTGELSSDPTQVVEAGGQLA